MPSKTLDMIVGEKNDIEVYDDTGYDPDVPLAVLLVENDCDHSSLGTAPACARSLGNAQVSEGCHGLIVLFRVIPPNGPEESIEDAEVEGPILLSDKFYGQALYNGPEFIDLPDGAVGILFAAFDNASNTTTIYLSARPPGAAWHAFSAPEPLPTHSNLAYRTAVPIADHNRRNQADDVWYPDTYNPRPAGNFGVFRSVLDARKEVQPHDFRIGRIGNDLFDPLAVIARSLEIETTEIRSLAFHPTVARGLITIVPHRDGLESDQLVFISQNRDETISVAPVWPLEWHENTLFHAADLELWGGHICGGRHPHPDLDVIIWFVVDHEGVIHVLAETADPTGRTPGTITEIESFDPPFDKPDLSKIKVVIRDDGETSEVRAHYRIEGNDEYSGSWTLAARYFRDAYLFDGPKRWDNATNGLEPVWVGGNRNTWLRFVGRNPVVLKW